MPPRNFLIVSNAYTQHTSENVLKRREILIKFLDLDYGIGRGVMRKVTREVERAGIKKYTEASLRNDIANYRVALRYLTGSGNERAKFEERIKRSDPNTFALKFLLEDGFKDWEQVKVAYDEFATQKTEDVAVSEIKQCLPEEIKLALSSIGTSVGKLFADNQQLLAENETLCERCLKLSAQLERVKLTHLEDLVLGFPQFPELFSTFQNIKKKIDKSRSPQVVLNGVLPEHGKRGERKFVIAYSNSFMREYQHLQPDEKSQIVKALGFIADGDVSSSSLQSHKLEKAMPDTPPGSYVSRAARDLRFTWREEGEAISICTIFRRGDKRFYHSE